MKHLSFYSFRPAYRGYTGGVLSIWRSQYETANGFSNEFWGWGGEDDEFYNRLKNKGFDVIRDLTRNAGFFSLEHDLTSANPDR
jgi:beta-1,4-galactosyltransferase 1